PVLGDWPILGVEGRAVLRGGIPEGACPADPTDRVSKAPSRNQKRRKSALRLLSGSIVSGAGVHLERGQTSGWSKLDLDAAPSAVADEIGGFVPDNILVAKLNGNLLHDIR